MVIERTPRLLGVFAHPDDESLGNGGTFARYAAEGVETYLLTATRGQRGWFGAPDENPGMEALGVLREEELRRAVDILGVREHVLLDYVDGDLAEAEPREVAGHIASYLRRIRPQVVITFGPDGAYGHPDHIAIGQFTTAAIVMAADAAFRDPIDPPHRVAKLYYLAPTMEMIARYEQVFGELVMTIDDVVRRSVGWPEWSITTWIDASEHWRQVFEAVSCHRSQLPAYDALLEAPPELHQALWGRQSYYRAMSTVNGGRTLETDLFEGLRESASSRP